MYLLLLCRRANKAPACLEKRAKGSGVLGRESEEESIPGTKSKLCSSCSPAASRVLYSLKIIKLMTFALTDFCRSSFEGYDGEEGDLPKRKEANAVKAERYSPWSAEREQGVRTESPPGTDARDMYNTEQLVPAPASYQPYG